MLRRLVAVVALVLSVGSFIEPPLGLLRDGAIHHEGLTEALAHSDTSPGEHGHEDAGVPAGNHDHQGQHKHGTPADHCTHVHGVALAASYTLQFLSGSVEYEFDQQAVIRSTSSKTFLRPPIA